MAAYFLVDTLEVTDREKIEEYKKHVAPLVAKFGGRYLIASGNVEVAEGAWRPTFPVLIQFPSLEQAHRWYDSEEYRPWKALRLAVTKSHGVFLEGN